MTRFTLPLAALFIGLAIPVQAQNATSIVRVRVVDTTGAPIADADVTAIRGLNSVVATGSTDAAGRRTLTVPRGSDEYQIVVRRIGFQRGDHFFRPAQDSVSMVVKLRSTPRELPTVEVTAEQDLKRKRYHIDADDIAASKRPILDALDIMTKLRPDMMEPPGQGIFAPRCGAYDVWINGRRIQFPPIDPGLAAKASQQRRAASILTHRGVTGQASVPVRVQSILAKIRPEHVEEMNYVDCRDTTMVMTHAQNAIFVALKAGVAYDENRGTYVRDAAETAAEMGTYRLRVLGLFDEATGEPIAGADVIDAATGTYATTTTTGTVSLIFLPEGASTLRIRKPGYVETKLDVSISPRDTIPITLTLLKPR